MRSVPACNQPGIGANMPEVQAETDNTIAPRRGVVVCGRRCDRCRHAISQASARTRVVEGCDGAWTRPWSLPAIRDRLPVPARAAAIVMPGVTHDGSVQRRRVERLDTAMVEGGDPNGQLQRLLPVMEHPADRPSRACHPASLRVIDAAEDGARAVRQGDRCSACIRRRAASCPAARHASVRRATVRVQAHPASSRRSPRGSDAGSEGPPRRSCAAPGDCGLR